MYIKIIILLPPLIQESVHYIFLNVAYITHKYMQMIED